MVTVTSGFRFGHVATAGVIGGVIFAAFEMIAAAILMGPNAFFMPLRMIGAMVLGPEALDPGYSLLTAAIAGLIVHMVLSVAFATVFAWMAPAAGTDAMLALGYCFFAMLGIALLTAKGLARL